jgi:acetylornithine deacetylase/succinyl-diaminopimelate desuccinylase-like protein
MRQPDVDREYLVDRLSMLARIPTSVPLGYDTLMEPDHPALVHYVQDILRPELLHLGIYDLLDVPRNNLVVQLGPRNTGRSLLIQNYTPSQHSNLMDDPFSGRVANAREFGVDGPAVFGQGVSQNKAHQAAMLVVLKMLREAKVELNGRLYWAINNEGRSSHACTTAILSALCDKPQFCLVQIGTRQRISLGNRGRVDIQVHVRGRVAHSSSPDDGLSAIDGACEVIQRLKRLTWPERHPLLGGRHAVVYKVRYEPVAPHTIPSDAYLTIDRRLLPGDDPDEATREIRDAIGDLTPYEVDVEQGVMMLPALVDAAEPGVQALSDAHQSVLGCRPELMHATFAFDAGGTAGAGIPTVMYGASAETSLTGIDLMPLSAVEDEARVLASFILERLG